eukprot:5952053-Heterocapsa_arctica.AAC.1
MDARHVEILEAAFPGGAFHPGLKVCSPIFREALRNTLTTNAEGRQLQTLDQVKEFLYGDQASWLETSDQPLNSDAFAVNKFSMGLLKAYQELTPETNNPFAIAGAYALDGEN